ncbi:two-component sensor histidine kinase [Bacillus shivajii]|uniref:sensor histidine kinase n=1 Tax=Bacillus shivajii TaxID=1983719 RepID=UPI001CFBFBCE|nr:ATP-binding protein [Bacillus shivajii]UCZ52757.1 two-component sensor histidine kinase [Bacillus shivajii]
MKTFIKNLSFRSKILTALLCTTLLLSSFSFILIHSIEEVNEVSYEIKNKHIPELAWISQWEEELKSKEYMVENAIINDFCCDFIEKYALLNHNAQREEVIDRYGDVPEALSHTKREIERLDFMIMNNVQGLLIIEDHGGAVRFIEEKFYPSLNEIQEELNEMKITTFHTLDVQSGKFPTIVKDAIGLLILITVLAIILSIIMSYRISNSLTRPVETVVEKVGDIADGQYGLSIKGSDQFEIRKLTSSINKMSWRLKESFDKILNDKIYWEQVLNSLPVGIITIEEKTCECTLNHAAEDLLSSNKETVEEEAKRKGHLENEAFWKILSSKRMVKNEKVSFQLGDDEKFLLVSQSALLNENQVMIGRIFYFVDITETEELEKRMHQTEKLALVGELAAGAAHEIRNPLAVIDGFLALMNQSFTDDQKEQFYVPLLMKELERINSIIEEMLLLTKPSAPKMKTAYIEDLLKDIIPLITKGNKEVSVKIDLERKPLLIDEKQMKQVFHNLIRNSIEAMEKQGAILIYSKVNQGFYQLYIEDCGLGIPEKMQESIFKPFLTSKEKGTGLGLTIVQRIIENHEGRIQLISSSDKGTTFMIELPLIIERNGKP